LDARGHQTLILAPGWSAPPDPRVIIVGRPMRIPFNGSVAPVCPDPRSRPRIRTALSAFKPDVVHAHEPFSPSTGFFATIDSPVPVVAVSHTYFERSVLFGLFSRVFARVWRRPAVWVGVSQASAAFIRRQLGADADVRVIPNGVDVEAFRDAKPADLPPGRRMLFVGRLEPRKGLSVAAAAFARLAADHPDLYLVVAGEGPERTALDRVEPGVRNRVIELGTVPHAELPRYHAAADVFVAPATGRESFGIVLVEALAVGLPVVASDIPGYREVVRAGVDGLLVPPGDPVALAEAVDRVLRDRDLARRLSAAARARAEAFRWESVADEVEVAYRDAVRGAR
jgi:phosphatidylinositol alpha-mannosyltransferase